MQTAAGGPLAPSVAERYRHGYAVLDVEATGLDARAHRVLQIALTQLDPHGGIEHSWSTLLDPGCDPGPTHIHGLTRAHLAGAPTFPQITGHLARMLDQRVLVAHNAAFDWRFLAAEAHRVDHQLPVRHRLCTMDLTRHLDLAVDSLSLATVAAYWGVRQTRAHDAVDDTRVLVEICATPWPPPTESGSPCHWRLAGPPTAPPPVPPGHHASRASGSTPAAGPTAYRSSKA